MCKRNNTVSLNVNGIEITDKQLFVNNIKFSTLIEPTIQINLIYSHYLLFLQNINIALYLKPVNGEKDTTTI